MPGKTRQLATVLPSRRLDPDELLRGPEPEQRFLSYIKQLDSENRPSIDLPWLRLLDTFDWKEAPPAEIIALAPLLIGTRRGTGARRQLPYLIIAQELTWLPLQQMLLITGNGSWAEELGAQPEQLPELYDRFYQHRGWSPIDISNPPLPAAPGSRPEELTEIIVLRDYLYVRAGQNIPELSTYLDLSDHWLSHLAATVGNQTVSSHLAQQVVENSGRQLLDKLAAALTDQRPIKELQLPYPWHWPETNSHDQDYA